MADGAILVVLVVIIGTVGVLAASSQALPDSPAYALRYAGERVRLVVASPVGRVELRIQFARDRFHQVEHVVQQNRSNATQLIADGSSYLEQAWRDLPSLSAGDRSRVQEKLNQADEEQESAEMQFYPQS
jgi:hypothetical protein